MNQKRHLEEIGNLYNEKVSEVKGSFEVVDKKGKAQEKKKVFTGKNTGPENASGFNKNISDPKDIKGAETFQGTEKQSSEKFTENTGKNVQKDINIFMSNIFDKLYEEVMAASQDDQDAIDLGLSAGSEAPASDVEPTAEGDVSFTLPRDVAHKLHEVLAAALETSEDKGEEKDESGDEGETEEDNQSVGEDGEGDAEEAAEDKAKKKKEDEEEEKDEKVAGEATELTALPDSKGHSLTSKNNKVGGTVDSLVAKGHGDGKVKSEVDGKGKDLPDSAGAKLQNKNNKVPGKASNTGHYLFQK